MYTLKGSSKGLTDCVYLTPKQNKAGFNTTGQQMSGIYPSSLNLYYYEVSK